MNSGRAMSAVEWHQLREKHDELQSWLGRLRIELDTSDAGRALHERFADLAKEFHEIELLMAN